LPPKRTKTVGSLGFAPDLLAAWLKGTGGEENGREGEGIRRGRGGKGREGRGVKGNVKGGKGEERSHCSCFTKRPLVYTESGRSRPCGHRLGYMGLKCNERCFDVILTHKLKESRRSAHSQFDMSKSYNWRHPSGVRMQTVIGWSSYTSVPSRMDVSNCD
jgi:hypothetical protein